MCNMKICKDWTDRSLKARLIGRNAVIQIELVLLKSFNVIFLGFYILLLVLGFYICVLQDGIARWWEINNRVSENKYM